MLTALTTAGLREPLDVSRAGLGKLLNLSARQFPPLHNQDKDRTNLAGLLSGINE